MPFRCAHSNYSGNEEPTLAELLAEPIVQLLMARDCRDEAEVRGLVTAAASVRLAWEVPD